MIELIKEIEQLAYSMKSKKSNRKGRNRTGGK